MRSVAATGLVLAVGALALGGCASGSSRDNGPAAPRALLSADTLVFTSFDADNDLRVTMAEIEAGIAVEWARANTNGDGLLQPLEFATWSESALGGNQLAPFRLDFDRNVDNSITEEEFRTELLGRARDYDKDEDGVLVRGDFIRQAPNRTREIQTERQLPPDRPRRR